MTRYTVAEAKNRLPSLLREAEAGSDVQVTRRGQPVAVVVGANRYEALIAGRSSFSDRYRQFLAGSDPDDEAIDPDEVFGDVRDRSAGREFSW